MSVPDFFAAPTLAGRVVRLERLDAAHAADLRIASDEGELWRKWTTHIPSPTEMDSAIAERRALQDRRELVPWAICDADTGVALGMSCFGHIDEPNRRLEIGWTWMAKAAQGTRVNPEAKLLMLTRAFEALDCIAVEFRTHWHNRQSRAAIAGLGAKQDGVLRSHQLGADGTLRDTVVFSITAAEWPAVRYGLNRRLEN